MDLNEFWDLLDKKFDPLKTYDDWLQEQLQLILTHPAGHIFNIDPIPIHIQQSQTKLSTDMENNYYWKLFTYLSTNKRYEVMIEVCVKYRLDRSIRTHTNLIKFSQIEEYLNEKCQWNYQLSFEKWFIMRV